MTECVCVCVEGSSPRIICDIIPEFGWKSSEKTFSEDSRGAVAWSTELQAVRSQVRFPMW